MKAAVVLVSAVGLAAAQFTGVPQCATNCILPIIPATGCSTTDIPCLCRHRDQLEASAVGCIVANCSPAEITAALAAVAKSCGN